MSETPATSVREAITEFADCGVHAFTTTRLAGDYGLGDGDSNVAALERWRVLAESLSPASPRLASAKQVHGTAVLEHGPTWTGWHRADSADGHVGFIPGMALAVTVADCVPVFVAHPSGTIALLHAGWRGTAGRILSKGLQRLTDRGLAAADLRVHLGPAICGRCYIVGPDVFGQLTGWTTARPRNVDLRALVAEQAKELGVTRITVSPYCTKCDSERFFSHRAGDAGRQVAVIVSPESTTP